MKFNWHAFKLGCLTTVLCLWSALLPAQQASVELRQRAEAIEQDAEQLAQLLEEGREIADFCANCHGEDGNAEKPGVPNLANQNPDYLLSQFSLYESGAREDFTGVMQVLVRNLTPAQRETLALYYAVTELRPVAYEAVLASAGKTHFERVCQLCHGTDGMGKPGYARIAGQKPDYVIDTLKLFRDKSSTEWRSRESSMMSTFAQNLTDLQVTELAHYVASLGDR